MSFNLFFKFLLVSVLSSVGIFFLINLITPLIQYYDLLILSLIFYFVLTVILYYLGEISIKRNKGKQFFALVIGSVLFKIVASLVLISIYFKQTQPTEKKFIIPFIIVYLCFTIAETIMLNKQVRGAK